MVLNYGITFQNQHTSIETLDSTFTLLAQLFTPSHTYPRLSPIENTRRLDKSNEDVRIRGSDFP